VFERFSEDARKMMALANMEALRFGHGYLGPEHMLLGLVKSGAGHGPRVLQDMGLDLRRIRLEVEKRIHTGESVSVGRVPQTESSKQVIVYAIEETRALEHTGVGTVHLLIGLIRDEGIAGDVLRSLGVALEDARARIRAWGPDEPDRAEPEPAPTLARRVARALSGRGKRPTLAEVEAEPSRLTDRARKVMSLANEEAQRFNHEYIGTEHLLLGLLKEGSGTGANVLKNLDVDLRKVRNEVGKLVKAGPMALRLGKLPQTPRARQVIDYAIQEARNLNHNYVGTEHLLLGLLREHDGVAAQVLRQLGLSLEETRSAVLDLLGASDEAPASAGTREPDSPASLSSPDAESLLRVAGLLRQAADELTELARKLGASRPLD